MAYLSNYFGGSVIRITGSFAVNIKVNKMKTHDLVTNYAHFYTRVIKQHWKAMLCPFSLSAIATFRSWRFVCDSRDNQVPHSTCILPSPWTHIVQRRLITHTSSLGNVAVSGRCCVACSERFCLVCMMSDMCTFFLCFSLPCKLCISHTHAYKRTDGAHT